MDIFNSYIIEKKKLIRINVGILEVTVSVLYVSGMDMCLCIYSMQVMTCRYSCPILFIFIHMTNCMKTHEYITINCTNGVK